MVSVKLPVLTQSEASPAELASSPPAAHLSLDVTDVERACRFYEALLGSGPRVRTIDHARFEHTSPPLVLSLVRVPTRGSTPLDHVGLRVGSKAAIDPFAERLGRAGVAFDRQDEVVCCDSEQTKIWAHDPDGIAWEIYVRSGDDVTTPAARPLAPARDAAREERRWVHGIRTAWPDRVEADDGSLDEVVLEGSINLRVASAKLDALLIDARRALRAGGTIILRGLVASAPLSKRALPLPGPASLVERVPVELEPLAALARAGFLDVSATTLRDRPDHVVGAVELREIVVRATAPAVGLEGEPRRPVIYLGPFARITDDHGVTFDRGIRAWITRAHAEAIALGPMAASFALAARGLDDSVKAEECCE